MEEQPEDGWIDFLLFLALQLCRVLYISDFQGADITCKDEAQDI